VRYIHQIIFDSTDTASAYSVFTDLICSLLPIVVVWNLKLALKQKIAICGLMAMGLMCVKIFSRENFAQYANSMKELPPWQQYEPRHWVSKTATPPVSNTTSTFLSSHKTKLSLDSYCIAGIYAT
jgi:hypothetical protein